MFFFNINYMYIIYIYIIYIYLDLQKQTFKLLWMCLFGSASSQLLGFAQWQTRCIQIVHCSPQSRRFWKCENFLSGQELPTCFRYYYCIDFCWATAPMAGAVADCSCSGCDAVADCSCGSCGGCGTCSLVLKGFGNKENKNTIHNAFKLAYDAACIGGWGAGAVRPNKSPLHFDMSRFSRMFALLGEDAYRIY